MVSNPTYDAAVEMAKAFPTTPTRTLAKKLASEYGITIESARGKLRHVRGTIGKKEYPNRKVEYEPGVAGAKPRMPESKAEPWLPYVLDASRVLVLSDVHVPYHSELALSTAVEYGKKLDPDALVLNGDICDFYTISRWVKNPKKRDFKAELDACRQVLEYFRAEFPEAKIVFKKGNHEERWDHWLWNHAPEISDMPEMLLENWLAFDEFTIDMVEDGRPIMSGKLPILHGHELPKGLTNPVNMARGAFLRMVDTVLVGHGHRSSSHTEATWLHKEITCWSQGCLCDLYPEYMRVNKWNWGFAFNEVDESGDFNLSNFRISKNGNVRKS